MEEEANQLYRRQKKEQARDEEEQKVLHTGPIRFPGLIGRATLANR